MQPEAITNLVPVEREDDPSAAAPAPVASVELFEFEPESQRVKETVTMLLASGGARLGQEVRQDLAIAIGELLLNAIEHGCLVKVEVVAYPRNWEITAVAPKTGPWAGGLFNIYFDRDDPSMFDFKSLHRDETTRYQLKKD